MSLEQRIENQIENCENIFIHIKFNPDIELKRNKPNEASWLQLTNNDAPITTRLKPIEMLYYLQGIYDAKRFKLANKIKITKR